MFLNELTPEKFDARLRQMVDSGITSADMLKVVVTLIYDKAVLEPVNCRMYARLCYDLDQKLPSFPCDEQGGIEVKFRRVLLNMCQATFEGADELTKELEKLSGPKRRDKRQLLETRRLGNVKLIGELLMQKMITMGICHRIVQKLLEGDLEECPAEENLEAVCVFLNTIGAKLDESLESRRHMNDIFSRMKEFMTSAKLSPRIKIMVSDLLDLRSNNWVPRSEEVKANANRIEFHPEAKENPGLLLGATIGIRDSRDGLGIDNYSCETCQGSHSLPEALACTEELNSIARQSELVKEVVSWAIEKGPPLNAELIVELLEHLRRKNVVTFEDIASGCLLYATLLEGLCIDIPRAPASFGEILGSIVLSGHADFKTVKEAIEKVRPESGIRAAVFAGAMRVVNGSPSGPRVVEPQASDVFACLDFL